MNLKDLKSQYNNLIKDENFDRLDLGLQNPNIFQILKISKTEIRHSNFLSWLLDPNQSHKLGDIFLKRFLREIFSSDKFTEVEQVDVENIDLNNVEIEREWEKIDLLIKLNNLVVCIENKVFSKEHSDQLKRYRKIIENEFPKHKKIFIYLTPEGDVSETDGDYYESLSYEFIVETLDRIISIYGKSLNVNVVNYIKDYITIIKREIMGTDKLTRLSKKIYRNHKEIFDFIYEHRPDVYSKLSEIIKEEIVKRGWILGSESKVYIRFYTKPIEKFIYFSTKKIGWKNRESFLFEIEMSTEKYNLIRFKTVVSPCDENYDRKRLVEILSSIEGFRKSNSPNWSTTKSISNKLDYENVHTLKDNEIRIFINKFLDKSVPIIQKVEEQFLSHSNELLKMKRLKN